MSFLIALFAIYLVVIFLNILFGMYSYKQFDNALWTFFILMAAIFIDETITYTFVFLQIKRTLISHIFSVVELSLICSYFIFCFVVKRKAIYISACVIIAIALGYINLTFFQEKNTYNSYMLVTESFFIVGMALYVLYSFLKNDTLLNFSRNIHFRIWIALLILWTGTFFYWGLFQYFLNTRSKEFIYNLMGFQLLLNIAVYGFLAYTFFSIKKLSVMRIKHIANAA